MSQPTPNGTAPTGPPRPRAAPERLLLRLEWRVLRRLDGRLAGGYRTAHRGVGTDLAGLREYVAGDDARHIDWNVTARLNQPQLRVFTEDRELTAWLLLDLSASMSVGKPGHGKYDVLSGLAITLARLFSRGGNRVGVLMYGNGALRTIPPGTGRPHVLRIAAELGRNADRRNTGRRNTGRRDGEGTTDLAAMLDTAARLVRRRALIIVISDFIGAGDWERSLLRLAPRHELVVLRVLDVADDELPEAGLVVVEDAETGEQLLLDSGDPLLRARLRTAVAERDAKLAAGMRRVGVPLHTIDTSADLTAALVEVIASTKRRRA